MASVISASGVITNGTAFAVTKSGSNNALFIIGQAKSGNTARNITGWTRTAALTAEYHTPGIPAGSLPSVHSVVGSQTDANITEASTAHAITWNGSMTNEFWGCAILCSDIDQTTPVGSISQQGFAAGASAARTLSGHVSGDIGVYVISDSQSTTMTAPSGWSTAYLLANEDSQLDNASVFYKVLDGTETTVIAGNINASSIGHHYVVILKAAAGGSPTPSISSISTPIVTNTQTTITGTDFEATQGTGAVTVGGEDVTESSWSDTSVQYTLDIESSVLKYGSHIVELTNNSGNSDTIAQVTNPLSTHSYVNIGTPATSGDRITAAGDLATSDQVRYENILYDGATPTAYAVSVADTGIFTISGSPPDGTYTFEVRVNDGTGWGAAADQTVVINTSGGVGGPSVGGQKMIESTIEPMITNMIED